MTALLTEGLQRSLFKTLMILEIMFAGIYLAFTRGLFIVYLVSIGFRVGYISTIVLVSTFAATIVSILLYRFPEFIVRKVKAKYLISHAAERILWIPMVLSSNPLLITLSYTGVSIASTLVGSFTNLAIYGSLDEMGVRDLISKRNAVFNATSILGFAAAMGLMAFLPPEGKFLIIFLIGSSVGLLSTVMIWLVKLSHLEGIEIPLGAEKPEQVFSTSSFLSAILTSGNLLGLFWIPYLIDVLKAPDYMAVGINLATTASSIFASILWAERSLKTFRIALGLTVLTPASALLIPLPIAQLGIAALNGVTYTGANFLGSFLLARYTAWYGAVRSSIVLSIISNVSQLLATSFGVILGGNYMFLFISTILVIVLANILAFLTIPEVAFVPEHIARTYSYILYSNGLMGYSITIQTTRETMLLTLKLLALALILVILYVAYRFVFFLVSL